MPVVFHPRLLARPLTLILTVALAFPLAGCGIDHHHPMNPMQAMGGATAVAPAGASKDFALPPGLKDGARGGQRRGFYPLVIGNRWSYAARFTITIYDSAGNASIDYDLATSIDRELKQRVTLNGRDYTEEVSARSTPEWINPLLSSVFYRQDLAGLYEADFPIRAASDVSSAGVMPIEGPGPAQVSAYAARRNEAVLRAVGGKISPRVLAGLLDRLDRATGAALVPSRWGGALDHEITRLAYPLHVGAHWVIRAEPRFESTVEQIGPVNEPAGRFVAARIRIDSEFFGPRDQVHLWYGRDGFLKLAAQTESPLTNERGEMIGRVVAEQTEDLVSLRLQSSAREP